MANKKQTKATSASKNSPKLILRRQLEENSYQRLRTCDAGIEADEMLTPTVANRLSFLYAIGNTPATSLTRSVPIGKDVDVLSLGCGDVRNILFTSYVERGLGNAWNFDRLVAWPRLIRGSQEKD